MRVLHVIASLAPRYGGPSEVCLELCRELARRGTQVAIYTTDIDGSGRSKVPLNRPVYVDGVQIRYFPVQYPRYYCVSLPLFNVLRRDIERFDIVHIHSMYLFHSTVAAMLCRRYGVPYVMRPHGTLDPHLRRRHRMRKWLHEMLVERRSFADAAAIHFTTEEEMILAASWPVLHQLHGGVFRKGVVIPNGVVSRSSHAEGESGLASARLVDLHPELAGKKLLLFMGRIDFKKGLDILVRAFAHVSRRHPDVHLVVAGPENDGYGSRVRRWLKAEGILQRATFTGMLLGAEKTAAFRSAEVFALPSYGENFGIAVAEAMSEGLPVVISNRVNIWREIEAAQAGLVVNCDVQEVAEALLKLLEDAELRAEMGRRGRRLVEQSFTWEVACTQALKVYREVLSRRYWLPIAPATSCDSPDALTNGSPRD